MPFAILDAVTHLRFVNVNIDIFFHLMLMLRMRALDYVAIPLGSSNHEECMACVSALLMHKRVKMVVLVLDREMEPEEWVARDKIAMSTNESLFVVPGAHTLQGVRTEWYTAVADGDDIWEKARRVREATITENHDEIRKLCALGKSCFDVASLASPAVASSLCATFHSQIVP
ncbi:uncharacterized protein LAESUDRAFT_808213 [Laetiporus sulphureus 93-53]|uniref:Uncharacterized protein n=1 Tax=Laetiporus sulphureus 93-53 TaxID=1314785 RepID=A0A165I654_9APHY|nr:uncharacterized protein LAESUDRAFT_808213 [Laetiporus sulphureus 93-53]KZT12643.1 hypothetical protein LAESUDRAFT_808213 [Laetiporus sulphureus 93-53]